MLLGVQVQQLNAIYVLLINWTWISFLPIQCGDATNKTENHACVVHYIEWFYSTDWCFEWIIIAKLYVHNNVLRWPIVSILIFVFASLEVPKRFNDFEYSDSQCTQYFANDKNFIENYCRLICFPLLNWRVDDYQKKNVLKSIQHSIQFAALENWHIPLFAVSIILLLCPCRMNVRHLVWLTDHNYI